MPAPTSPSSRANSDSSTVTHERVWVVARSPKSAPTTMVLEGVASTVAEGRYLLSGNVLYRFLELALLRERENEAGGSS